MRKRWRLPPWLDTLLRWWWRVYSGVVLAAVVSDIGFAIAQNGPGALRHYLDKYSYLRQLALAHPVLFWGGFGAVTLLAVAGFALNAIAWWEARGAGDRRRRTYLEAVDRVYQVIPLVIDAENVQRLPEIVYQKLRYQSDPTRALVEPGGTEALPGGVEADDIQQVLDAGQTRSLIILGRPGGGKTTLLRHSMSKLARQAMADQNAYLPVFISLPRFARVLHDGGTVAGYLRLHEQALADIPELAKRLDELVRHGEAFLFLDGLDEVDPGYRRKTLDWIRAQQRLLNLRGALVVSTRFTDYARGDFIAPQDDDGEDAPAFAEFAEWVAQEMDHETRVKLATNLLPALLAQLKRVSPELARHIESLDPAAFVALVERHALGSIWGGNPLLFSLAAFVYVQNAARGTADLPQSRVTLYSQSITALLAKIVRARHETDAPGAVEAGITREMLRVLAEFALWLSLNGWMDAGGTPPDGTRTADARPGQSDSQSFTYEVMVAGLEQVGDQLRLPERPQEMATWVRNSGTLQVEGKGTFAFRHHTYQEYLTALALAQRLVSANEALRDAAWRIAREKRFVPTWAEPMRLLAGALVAESAQGWPQGRRIARDWFGELSRLTAWDGASPDQADAALALAVASLPEIPDVAAFGAEVDAAGLLAAWADALLRAARTQRDGTLGELQRLAPGVAVLPPALARPALDRLQGTLADASQPEQQITAARALEGMGDLVEVAPLARMLTTEGDAHVRAAAARALAKLERGGQEHPGHAALRSGLAGGDVALARIIAEALVEAGDVAYPLMLAATERGRDAEVRRLGMLALGGVGPRAEAPLRRLLGDGDPAVAVAAIEMLNRLGEDSETLLAALPALVRQGADTALLTSAMHSLLPHSLRQLGFAGDWRNGAALIVPPVCEAPAGEFLMGSDKRQDPQAYNDEMPQHRVALDAFAIGQYPVTVAEYACFVRATKKEPRNWRAQLARLDHPVVNISWRDAVAYAAWLARQTGQRWRLPTEAEWEKAARGTDGRIYPWGNEWDKTRANTGEGGPGATTPVGTYADRGDASPYGAHDLAGNVWEWTSSLFKSYGYSKNDGTEDLKSTENRVLRGGSWNDDARFARAACRILFRPGILLDGNGFRLVVAPARAGS